MESRIIYKIIPVNISTSTKTVPTHAIIDSGSAVSLINTKFAKKLRLQGINKPLAVEWTDKTVRVIEDSLTIPIQITGEDDRSHRLTVRSMDIDLPTQYISKKDLLHIGTPENSVKPYNNVTPQILLGLDNATLTANEDSKIHKSVVLTRSKLGWALEGKIGEPESGGIVGVTRDHMQVIQDAVTKFIEFDNYGLDMSRPIIESKEITLARKTLQDGVKNVGGRYEAPLLWRNVIREMPDNSEYARRRFLGFEKKMECDPNLRREAHAIITTYLEKEYIKRVEDAHTSPGWYLPIFAVTGKKTRLVIDAAATFKGYSLNNQLLAGPDLNEPLWDIWYRFREWPVAVCADISEMFHQILVRMEDQRYQRFFWRFDKKEEIVTFEMQVMTFGASCSPCIAQFIKNYNAKLYEEAYPEAVRHIIKDTYVDDLVMSCKSVKEASEISQQVIDIHKNAGFKLDT